MGIRTIEQKISAGAQFTGLAPGGAMTRGNDMESYAASTAGGLFDFKNDNPITVHQIAVVFGGQSSWSIVLVDTDSTELPIVDGTTDPEYLDWDLGLILLQGQKLKLVTAGASGAMRARVSVVAVR